MNRCRWIKLAKDDRHHDITALAAALGVTPERALAWAIRWFFYIDEHISSGRKALTAPQIDAAVEYPGFCQAIASPPLSWLKMHGEGDDVTFSVAKYDKYFGPQQRIREQNRVRQQRHRDREKSQPSRVTVTPEQSKAQEEETRRKLPAGNCMTANGAAPVSTSNACGDEKRVRDELECVRLLKENGVAPNCMRKAVNLLMQIPDPLRFLRRIIRQSVDQQILKRGAYIYKAIESEAGGGDAPARGRSSSAVPASSHEGNQHHGQTPQTS